ncbi:MAG TPA: hypothetical protein VES39_11830 [Rhodospirillales bacterium]|nr:hypothetical protein [Rhodospirillales bacterium]
MFDQEKAMAVAEAIERNTITPPAFEAALARLESRLTTVISELRAEMRTEIANVRTEIAHSRGEMLKWMAGVAVGWVVAVAGIAFAIVRLGTP